LARAIDSQKVTVTGDETWSRAAGEQVDEEVVAAVVGEEEEEEEEEAHAARSSTTAPSGATTATERDRRAPMAPVVARMPVGATVDERCR
jgi:hypothetical protein